MNCKIEKMPTLHIEDKRLSRIVVKTWHKLPNVVKAVLLDTVTGISEYPRWSEQIKQSLDDLHIERNCSNWNQYGSLPKGEVQFSKNDYADVTDLVISGSFLHELGHAYQTALTPSDVDAIERAGDQYPVKWGFIKEIDAVKKQREIDMG